LGRDPESVRTVGGYRLPDVDAELARLGAAIEAAPRGRGALVLLEGEAGVG